MARKLPVETMRARFARPPQRSPCAKLAAAESLACKPTVPTAPSTSIPSVAGLLGRRSPAGRFLESDEADR